MVWAERRFRGCLQEKKCQQGPGCRRAIGSGRAGGNLKMPARSKGHTGSVRWSGTGENENGDEVFMEIKAIATGR